jgi:predicted metal-dependent peptidase
MQHNTKSNFFQQHGELTMSTATALKEVEQYPVTPAHSATAKKRLTRAVSSVILDDPFYGAMAVKFNMIENNKIKGTRTDGKNIEYNARYVSDLTDSQTKGLLRCITASVVQAHHLRRGARDSGKWNKASDGVVYGLGREAGWDLPPDAQKSPDYKDYSVEHAYTLIPDSDDDGDGDGDGDGGGMTAVADAPGSKDEATRKQMEAELNSDVINAYNAAKMMGNAPAHMERYIEELLDAKLPWKTLLARYFKSVSKDDFSWNVPNRRYLQMGYYLPAMHSHTCGPVVLAIDTSGSIGPAELKEFISELNGLVKQAKPSKVYVLYCDAEIQRVEEYGPHDDVRATKPAGGGGTAFEPVFQWVHEKGIQPECVVYLTDMYGSFPKKTPTYDTIWVSTSDIKTAPFGKVIRM